MPGSSYTYGGRVSSHFHQPGLWFNVDCLIESHFTLLTFRWFLELKRILQEKLDNEIPVITVVSVMGTTEESAVDPLTEILELRKQFRTKVRLVCNVY